MARVVQTFSFTLILLISLNANAKCDFARLAFEKRDEKSSTATLNKKLKLVLEGTDSERLIHEGPAWIEENGKKKCEIKGGIYREVYFSPVQKLIMVDEYSGSCGENRIIDIATCQQKGPSAEYCGAARLEGTKLINPPPCEPLDKEGKLGSCGSGKVFQISAKNCALTLDEKASRKLTKEKLGIELPSFDKTYRVSNIGSTKAKIEPNP